MVIFLVGNADLCRQINSPSTVRDIRWTSQNCTLSFQTVGIWPENADGSDVNTVSRNLDETLLVTGDDWGRVKLYSCPASQPKVIKLFGKFLRLKIILKWFFLSPRRHYRIHMGVTVVM